MKPLHMTSAHLHVQHLIVVKRVVGDAIVLEVCVPGRRNKGGAKCGSGDTGEREREMREEWQGRGEEREKTRGYKRGEEMGKKRDGWKEAGRDGRTEGRREGRRKEGGREEGREGEREGGRKGRREKGREGEGEGRRKGHSALPHRLHLGRGRRRWCITSWIASSPSHSMGDHYCPRAIHKRPCKLLPCGLLT